MKIRTIDFSHFALDGGAMFGIIPKTLWSRRTSSDERNRIPLGLRSLLVEGPGFRALIDVGMGNKWDSVSEERYFYQNLDYDNHLKSHYGVDRDSITHVFVTHLHFDHAGGLTSWDPAQNQIVPVFKNAQVMVHQRNFEWAMSDPFRERGSYRRENFESFAKDGRLTLLKGNEGEALPGLHFELSEGHTRGQCLFHLETGNRHSVFCGDLLPTRAHVDLHWGMGYDIEPLKIIDEKKQLLQRAFSGNWKLYFPHDPEVSHSTLRPGKSAETYTWAESD